MVTFLSSRLRTALLAIVFVPVLVVAAPPPSMVVVISVDGLPADYLASASATGDLPTLRRMVAEGAHAGQMTAVFPAVTWPNHTSMVTGVSPARHGVLGNIYYDRAAREEVRLIWDPVFDKEQIVKVPTVYDVAHQAGLKTAGIAWPGARNAKHLDWQVPCVIETDLFERYTTPVLLTYLKEHGIAPGKKAEWNGVDLGGKQLWDWMHADLARHVLVTEQPSLLLLHLDGVDALQHRSGHGSPEARWAMRVADSQIAALIAAVETAGLADRTTFVVVSDHGFRNYTKQINLNVLLRDAGLIKTAGNRIVESQVYFVNTSGGGGLYVLDEANRELITRDLVARLRAVEGVEAVMSGAEIVAQGLPAAADDPRSPDIMVSAADGYSFTASVVAPSLVTAITGVKGIHGHLPDVPRLHASFVAWGAAIKPGVTIPRIRNVDVAPTVAAILGVSMPTADGRVLTEILR